MKKYAGYHLFDKQDTLPDTVLIVGDIRQINHGGKQITTECKNAIQWICFHLERGPDWHATVSGIVLNLFSVIIHDVNKHI